MIADSVSGLPGHPSKARAKQISEHHDTMARITDARAKRETGSPSIALD
jgi:hypothetical protein